jgi:hypothetical protein
MIVVFLIGSLIEFRVAPGISSVVGLVKMVTCVYDVYGGENGEKK